jgi:tetratricopeptide (TPR) repeat protein
LLISLDASARNGHLFTRAGAANERHGLGLMNSHTTGFSPGTSHGGWRMAMALALCLTAPIHPTALRADIADPIGVLPAPKLESYPMLDSGATLAEALGWLNRGEYDKALAKAKELIAADPANATAHELAGAALAKSGKVDEGLKALRESIRLDPRQASAITKIGDIHMARGEIDQAKARFQQAVAIDPEDRRAHQRLGLIYEQENDDAKAVAHFEKGLAGTPPDYLGVKVNLGNLYNNAHQFDKTVALLEPQVDDQCQEPGAHVVLGAAYLGLKKTDAALRAFERAKRLEPDSARTHLALGIAYRQAGDLGKSAAELDRAVKLKPDWSAGHYQRAETLVAQNRIDPAVDSFNRAAQFSKTPAPIRNRTAEFLASRQRPEPARAIYEKLHAEGKADLRTYDGWATLLQVAGDLSKAESLLLDASRKFATQPFAHYRLGLFYGFSKQYAKAIESLSRAHQMAPADPYVLNALAMAEARGGRPDAAIASSRKLVALQPHQPEPRFLLASLLQDRGAAAEAMRLYDELLRTHTNHVGALNNQALLLAAQGDLARALPLAERAARLAPTNGSVLDTHGWLLFKQGKLAPARAALEKAAAAAGSNPSVRYHLGQVYAKLGDAPKAAAELAKALELAPEFPERKDAVQLLAQLKGK